MENQYSFPQMYKGFGLELDKYVRAYLERRYQGTLLSKKEWKEILAKEQVSLPEKPDKKEESK